MRGKLLDALSWGVCQHTWSRSISLGRKLAHSSLNYMYRLPLTHHNVYVPPGGAIESSILICVYAYSPPAQSHHTYNNHSVSRSHSHFVYINHCRQVMHNNPHDKKSDLGNIICVVATLLEKNTSVLKWLHYNSWGITSDLLEGVNN